MGKKDKGKKKGKGAEKTAERTEKKIKLKLKKATGEDDVESIVNAIEEEERKRQEVKEVLVCPPSHRSNLSMCTHPEAPEIVFFGGEFYNGQKTLLYNDLLIYDIKRKDWKQIKSPAAPPPRSSHQAVVTAQAGGQMWMFGGEYASPSETQFHHYKDLWVYHFATKRWEKIQAKDGPSARSGHRMVMVKRHLVVFGGFHDSLRGGDSKYFNDVHLFDTDERQWKKIELSGVKPPSPRSGCNMLALADGRIVIYGGFCKEKTSKKSGKRGDDETGRTMSDMYLLVPDKHEITMSKWRWFSVKQVGSRPCPRSGMSSVAVPNSNRCFFFGGVQDGQNTTTVEVDSDDEEQGIFFNDLHVVQLDGERATWQKVQVSAKLDEPVVKRKKEAESNEDIGADSLSSMALDKDALDAEKTKVVEEGAFTITSTISSEKSSRENVEGQKKNENLWRSTVDVGGPSPRFSSCLAMRQGVMYLFGGVYEDEEDRQLTLNDFYSLDTKKLDSWETIISSDMKTMQWFDSETSEDSSDEEEEMDTE